MDSVLKDLKYALHLLVRTKTFTGVALLTLALCIGANTAIFSVVNAVLLRPLPYPESDRLVLLYNTYPGILEQPVDSYNCCNAGPDYFDRKNDDAFESLAMFHSEDLTIGGDDAPRRIVGLRATPSLFTVLRVAPALGRPFTDAESEVGNERVVILGHGLWQEMFAGARSALGQSIRLSDVPHEIVGVMPEGFDLLDRDPQLVVPLALTPVQREARHSNFGFMLARLAPGVGVPLAQERIDALNDRVHEQFPEVRPLLESARFRTLVVDFRQGIVRGVEQTLYLLWAAVAFVLLIGCVNIANLLLIRSHGRTQELAIRFALGAGRWRVARQLLTESLVLAVVGGGLGLAVAWGAMQLLGALGVDALPRGGFVGLNARVVLFAAGVALVTGLGFGMIPALHVSRGNLEEMLRQAGRSGSPGGSAAFTRGVLVVAQVSLAFMLLIGAGLMVTSFARVLDVDPGFRAERVLTAKVNLPEARYERPADVRSFTERALDALGALPAVQSVGLTSLLPFSNSINNSAIMIEGYTRAPGESPAAPHFTRVAGDYFTVMGIPLVDGRLFDSRDGSEATPVVIIDQHLADRYWPDGSPLGGRLRRGIEEDGDPTDDGQWATIVGIVGNVKLADLAAEDRGGTVYFPQAQSIRREVVLVIRTATDDNSGALQPAVRRAIAGLDPALPLYDVQMMEARVANSLVTRRAPMILLLIFAGIALFLSAIGIYGVLAHSVSLRTKELGIKMALGADGGLLLRQTLWQGVRLVLVGLVAGLAGALTLGRLIASLLYGVEPTDPRVFALVITVLVTVSFVACLIPSRRATCVDPVTALRDE